ncbi:hypothetical protein D3C81_2227000 [compost metagenome]
MQRGIQSARYDISDFLNELINFLRGYDQIMPERLQHLFYQRQPFLLRDIVQHAHNFFGMSRTCSDLPKMLAHHLQHIVHNR